MEQKIIETVFSVSGKDIKNKRIAALRTAGFHVEFHKNMWNFGRAGTTKPQKDGSFLVQLHAATSRKFKNGRGDQVSSNLCGVYKVTPV